jgi:Family of unknown function (DUF5703)
VCSRKLADGLLKLIEPPVRSRTMMEMAEYSYMVLYLPRGMPREAARRILTDHAEHGHWELARLRLNADGSRKATLRRPIIRQIKTPRSVMDMTGRWPDRGAVAAEHGRYGGLGTTP